METRTYQVYKYDELSGEGKENALNRHADINTDYEWYEYLFEDAKTIGLEISEFDTYHNTIDGSLLESIGEVCKRIIANHGKTCDTYKLAQRYFKGEYRTGDLDKDRYDFKYDLLKEYLSLLRQEADYLTSREAIEETFRANDYDFTNDGKID